MAADERVSRGAKPPGPPEEGCVAALNHDGEGVLRGAKTAFVPGALPGERIVFQRVRRHRQHDEGALVEVVFLSFFHLSTHLDIHSFLHQSVHSSVSHSPNQQIDNLMNQ